MAQRRRSNPLALAVLACLHERPMHPYEMATLMRSRAKHESIKLNYGSLYTVVDALARNGLIEPLETQREGRRPERTIYALTPAGQVELQDWLSEMLSTPVKEYTQFEGALSLMPALPPGDVVQLLDDRITRLELQVRQMHATRELMAERGLPRLFGVEAEYALTLREAELAWVKALARELADGSFEGLAEWQAYLDGQEYVERGKEGAAGRE